MKSIIKIILLCFTALGLAPQANAGYSLDNYTKQSKILKSIDVDTKYLQNANFMRVFSYMSEREVNYFSKVLNAANRNIPIIKAVLKKHEVPDVFLYLAMVESNFNPQAKSGVRALGIWQFMAPTARSYGLKIDKYVDERRDVLAASEAAAKYLLSLKEELGKWYLAIFAYNCGNGCVRRAIKRAGTDDLQVLLDENKKFIPLETRSFFRKILSTSLIAENDILLHGDAYLLNQIMALNISRVSIPASQRLSDIAMRAHMNLADLKALNPQFNGAFTPPYEYHIYLPIEKVAAFSEPKAKYAKSTVNKMQSYRVKTGDTLYMIARKNGVSVAAIKNFNNLKSDFLSVNQTLLIPVLSEQNYEAKK